MIGYFQWNPSRVAFEIPFIGHPIAWYGILFVTGFFCAYALMVRVLQRNLPKKMKHKATEMVDQLLMFSVIGTLVGARLGHVLFYDLHLYLRHPLDIFKVWEGGLASHGGVIGVVIALFLFCQKRKKELPEWSFLTWMDLMTYPTTLVAVFIRFGNFVNQEIVGVQTTVPWAVVFENPFDGNPIVPRHPVQLYEAAAYLGTFFVLGAAWRFGRPLQKPGMLTGLFFTCVFGSRIFLESFKEVQPSTWSQSYMQMGQLLSIPFVIFGLLCYAYSLKNRGGKTCPNSPLSITAKKSN